MGNRVSRLFVAIKGCLHSPISDNTEHAKFDAWKHVPNCFQVSYKYILGLFIAMLILNFNEERQPLMLLYNLRHVTDIYTLKIFHHISRNMINTLNANILESQSRLRWDCYTTKATKWIRTASKVLGFQTMNFRSIFKSLGVFCGVPFTRETNLFAIGFSMGMTKTQNHVNAAWAFWKLTPTLAGGITSIQFEV